jgi:hypothetical protein
MAALCIHPVIVDPRKINEPLISLETRASPKDIQQLLNIYKNPLTASTCKSIKANYKSIQFLHFLTSILV